MLTQEWADTEKALNLAIPSPSLQGAAAGPTPVESAKDIKQVPDLAL